MSVRPADIAPDVCSLIISHQFKLHCSLPGLIISQWRKERKKKSIIQVDIPCKKLILKGAGVRSGEGGKRVFIQSHSV